MSPACDAGYVRGRARLPGTRFARGHAHADIAAGADVAAAEPEQAAPRPRTVDPALAAPVDAAIQLAGADIAGVLLADGSGEVAEMCYDAGNWTVHAANLRLRRGYGLVGRILQTRKPWKVDDYHDDRSISAEEFLPVLHEEGTRSGLGAPMLAGDMLPRAPGPAHRRVRAHRWCRGGAGSDLGELAACGALRPIRGRVAARLREHAEPVAVLPPRAGFPRWTMARAAVPGGSSATAKQSRLALSAAGVPPPPPRFLQWRA